jgi:hypothetical protein
LGISIIPYSTLDTRAPARATSKQPLRALAAACLSPVSLGLGAVDMLLWDRRLLPPQHSLRLRLRSITTVRAHWHSCSLTPMAHAQLLSADDGRRPALPLAASQPSPANPRLCCCCRIARSLLSVLLPAAPDHVISHVSRLQRPLGTRTIDGHGPSLEPFTHTHLPSTRLLVRPKFQLSKA